jgi:hypothetical protein
MASHGAPPETWKYGSLGRLMANVAAKVSKPSRQLLIRQCFTPTALMREREREGGRERERLPQKFRIPAKTEFERCDILMCLIFFKTGWNRILSIRADVQMMPRRRQSFRLLLCGALFWELDSIRNWFSVERRR